MMSVRVALRSATAAKHEIVDRLFGDWDLGTAEPYGRFLTAHARALIGIERALSGVAGLPFFRSRAPLLGGDLQELGLPVPQALGFEVPGSLAAGYGALYVLEGSRLGGALLARKVPESLPRAYLSASHEPGDWRAFVDGIDHAGAAGGADWLPAATRGAEAAFDLFTRAAALPA